MVKVDNEFKMNWVHAAEVERERPFFTRASQRQCLREATRGRCVSGARVQRRQGLPRTKVEKTPLVPQDRPINQTVRNWSRSARRPRGTRSSECSDNCRSQESEVADVRQTTAKRRLESRTKRPRRQIRVRRCANSMAWKPLETRPHHVSGAREGSGADASHRQCRHGWTQTKKQPGKGPQNPRK